MRRRAVLAIIHKTLRIPPTILKQYHPGTFLPVPMQNPCILSLLCCVLEPDKLEGRFIQILLFFHVLLCGHCLNPDLFQNTGKLSKLFFKDIESALKTISEFPCKFKK